MTDAICPETLTLMEYISRKFWLSSSNPILLTTRPLMGKGGDAGCTDHRVQFFAFGQEQVQQLCKQHAACGIKNEGYQTQCKDEQGIGPDELVSGHLPGHGQAQHDGDEVCQHILRGFAEGVQYAALPQQVAEHQKTNESYAGRSYHTGNDGYHNGEQNLRQLADIALFIGHPDAAVLLGGQQFNDRRLHDGHQSHVTVRCHHDGTKVLGVEGVSYKMAVGPSAAPMTAMEAASFKSKKKPARNRVKKIPNCAAAPKSMSHGFSSRGPKSIIAPMPMKSSRGNSSLDMPASNRAEMGPTVSPCVMAPDSGRLTRMAPKPMGKSRLGSIFGDGKVDEQCTNAPHHHHLPSQVSKIGKQTCECVQKVHSFLASYCAPVR